jgi:CHASE2 domain-containing sensor protein
MAEPMMTAAVDQTAQAWAIVLYSLGAILAITGILGATSAGMRRMKRIGSLMLLYGIVMIGVGALMYGGYAPTMGNLVLSSAGMLAVGVLMILNGALMSRSDVMRM